MITSRDGVPKVGKEGLVLSGPHGVGKSAVLYLMACVAWARGWIVVYIPKCAVWCGEPDDSLRALFFLKQVWEMNKDLLGDTIETEYGPLSIQPSQELKDKAVNTQAQLMSHFAQQQDHAVLYALDEHNELFRERNDAPLHKHPILRKQIVNSFSSTKFM